MAPLPYTLTKRKRERERETSRGRAEPQERAREGERLVSLEVVRAGSRTEEVDFRVRRMKRVLFPTATVIYVLTRGTIYLAIQKSHCSRQCGFRRAPAVAMQKIGGEWREAEKESECVCEGERQ